MNFKSNAAYKKWLGYGHASGEFAKTPGNQPVSIKGKSHKVKHEMGGNMYAAGGSFNNKGFNSLPAEVQQKIKQNSMGAGGLMPTQNPYNMNVFTDGVAQNFAFGGNMRSYASGGMLDNQLTEFNNGGRHEENPIGGIPQGFAPGGQVNLVEQGETKLNSANYIFSDTLKVTKDIVLDYNLPKDATGKTFADVSKKMNRPTSRRENDTIEEVAKQRDLDNLMQAQEDFKQRDLQKDIDMMAEKHPEFMQQMMGQEQPEGIPQELLAQGVPPDQMMAAEGMMGGQAPQSVQPMGMPQGMPMDPNQIPPEMLAQMPEAQMGQPVMAYGGHIYKCGGKMYNFGGHMYARGGQVLRGIGAGAYGLGEGLLDTLTGGLTDSITDKGFELLSGLGDRTAADIEREKMIKGFGNTMGAVGGGIASGGAMTGSAISQGSQGLGQGLTNIQGTGEKFDNTVNTLSSLGSMAGGFVNPTESISGITDIVEKAANVPKFATKIMEVADNPMLKQVPGVLNAVGGFNNLSTMDATEMGMTEDQNMNPANRMYRGYNVAPTFMKYGGYKAQAPWHNFPQYTPNYPGNAGPMYMGLGTNLFANGGMMMPGPGDPPKNDATTLDEVVVTAGPQGPVMIDNPIYSNLMEQYTAGLPKGGTYNNKTWSGTSVRDADLTRKLTDEELANWTKYYQNRTRQEINSLKAQGQDYSEKLAQYNFIPKAMYVPAIPTGMGEDYYSNPENWYYNTKYLGENYSKPSKQIEDIFAVNTTPQIIQEQAPVLPTITMAEAEAMKNKAMQEFGSSVLKGKNWNYNEQPKNYTGTQAGGGMFNYWDESDPTQAANQKEYEQFIQDQLVANPDKVLYDNLGGVDMYSNPNYEAELAKNINEGPQGHLYDQFIAKKYNEYINNPEWVNSLSEEDNAKYLFDKSKYNIQMNVPEVMGFANGGYINRNNTMYSPDLTYAAKMGGQLYNYGGGLKSPLMPLPVGNFVKYNNGGKIVQGTGNDPYQYKAENGKYYTAKKGTSSWSEISPLNKAAYAAIKALIDSAPTTPTDMQDFKDVMMANISAEQSGELVPPTIEEAEANQALAIAEEKMQNAETSEEYQEGASEYQSVLQRLQEKLANRNTDLSMNQGLLSGAAMAIPAAYNLGAGIFGKAEQLDPREYMIPEDITPYEYNINPQLAAANQTYAQAQEAFRNASTGGGNYMANMQQLANARNTDIGEAYTNKQNLDAAQIQAAKAANKEIQTANLERQMSIEDFNRLSKAAKQGLLQTGLTQLADIGKNAESKKLDLAYIKAVAPDFAENLSYSALGEQFLKFLQSQKELNTTNKTK
jgi:hypothetical protein